MKEEYDRTRFQTIRKDRLPFLLNKLWANNPMQMKINLVKSFMATGIFPFNPNGIDRSKIIRTRANGNKYSSNFTNTSANNNQSTVTTKSSQSNISHSSFTSSHQAITVLNDILQQTQSILTETEDSSDEEENNLRSNKNDNSNDDEEEDEDEREKDEEEKREKEEREGKESDDDDDDYIPSQSNLYQPSTRSSKKTQSIQANKIIKPPRPTIKYVQSSLSQRAINKKNPDIIGFDSSEEDGNFVRALSLL